MKRIIFTLLFVLFAIANYAAAPILSANATQACFTGTTKPMLVIAAGSGKTSYVSGAIGDPTDCAATKGIYFTATNSPTSFTITSSTTSVVPVANIKMTLIKDDQYVLTIIPTGVGFTKITIIATNGSTSGTYTIQYAASPASTYTANTIFPTIVADASAEAAIDDNYFFEADDELNNIRLYSRKESGQSLYVNDITSAAGGVSGEEFDLEAATMSSSTYNSGRRIYWIGSLGNSKSGGAKPYRDRVIATDISGTGANATISVKSYKIGMRAALISWGDGNSWDFTTSASTSLSMIPKRIDGFNIEGLTVTNEGEKAYIGFRAPCVPLKGVTATSSNRKYALLAPVTNFETMMNVSGISSVTPTMGEPILFDFGGLGIRDMVRVGGNKYVIIAGLFEGGGTPAIYLWDGIVPTNPGSNPITTATSSLIKLPFDISDLVQPSADGGVEGHPEGVLAEQVGNNIIVHLICDNGTVTYYDATTAAKDLAADPSKYPFAKFRYDTYVYSLDGAPSMILTSGSSTQTINHGSSISNIIYTCGGPVTGVNASGLPTGVTATYNSLIKAVTISGTPSVTGTFNYTLTTTQTSGTAAVQSGTITIVPPAVQISTPSSINASATGTTINLSWPAVANATDYTVNLCKASAGTKDSILYFNSSSSGNSHALNTGDVVYGTTSYSLSSSGSCSPSSGVTTTYRTGSYNNYVLILSTTDNISKLVIGAKSSGSSVRTLSSYTIKGVAYTSNITNSGVATCGEYAISGLNLHKGDSITLNFDNNAQLSYFIATVGSTSSTCTETTVSTNSFSASGLDANTTYTYQVKANTTTSGYSSSEYSTAASVTTSTSTGLENSTKNFNIIQTRDELLLTGIDCTKLTIYSISGEKVASTKSCSISTNSLLKGLYLITVQSPDGTINSKKFIKR